MQLHERMGVKGISWWLRWPIQKAPESYTLTYAKGISEFQYTRKRGGNPDAFSSFFIALPVAGITAAVNDDTNMGIRVANSLVQVWMLFVVCVGPFVHITGGQPGMTPDHIFNMNGTQSCLLDRGNGGSGAGCRQAKLRRARSRLYRRRFCK